MADINPDLLNFYRALKSNPLLLHEMAVSIESIPSEYIRARQRFNSENDLLMRAALFWYLNRNCFNGLFRTNKMGMFNVPFGKKIPAFPNMQHTGRCSSALKATTLLRADCREVIDLAERKDFLYIDPPYHRTSTRDRGEYGLGALTDVEIDSVLERAIAAGKRGASVVISYNRNLSHLLPNWNSTTHSNMHVISAATERRLCVDEYIFWNY